MPTLQHWNKVDRTTSALSPPHFGQRNPVRLHSAVGFITPADMLPGRQKEIHDVRDRKLEEARRQRQIKRRQAA